MIPMSLQKIKFKNKGPFELLHLNLKICFYPFRILPYNIVMIGMV